MKRYVTYVNGNKRQVIYERQMENMKFFFVNFVVTGT